MKKITIEALAEITKAKSFGTTAGFFTGVNTDSRTIQKGDCFFAVTGPHFNGTDFLLAAFEKGASCAVIDHDINLSDFNGRAILKVQNTVEALGDFARQYRRQMNFKLIAITGSVGKTTTRHIICHVLNKQFEVVQSPRNFNNNIGLPLTILLANDNTEIVVAELGSNHSGEIAYLTKIAQPDIAVITAVCQAHLEGFGDIDTIIEEKLSISQALASQGEFFINANPEKLSSICKGKNISFKTFGVSGNCDIKAENIVFKGRTSRFTVKGVNFELPLPGLGNIENTLAALSVCVSLGASLDDFADSVKTLPVISMRSEILQTGTLTILSDCYNANPGSMKNALNILSSFDNSRRSVFVCGDMAELGSQSANLHEQLGKNIAQAGVQLLLLVGKFASITASSAKLQADYDLQVKCFKDTSSLSNNLRKLINDFDIILIKGSRVNKLEEAIEKLMDFYS